MQRTLFTSLVLTFLAVQHASAQDLLVTSRFTDEVLRYSASDGSFVGVFAQGGGLDNPVGLTFGPDGDLYVASADSSSILVYDGTDGSFLRTFTAGGPLTAPRNLNFGPDGDLYVAVAGVNQILRYALDGTYKGVFAQGNGLNGPTSFTFGPRGDLLVVSVVNNRVLRFNGTTGAFIGTFTDTDVNGPHDVAYGPDGLVYVSNAFGVGQKVRRFDQSGNFVDVFINGLGLQFPLGMTWTRSGELLIASQGNDSVRRFDARDGSFIDIFVPNASGGLDAPLFIALMPETQAPELWPVTPGSAGEVNAFGLTGGQPGGLAIVRFGSALGASALFGCPTVTLGLAQHRPLGRASLDESGNALFLRDVPAALAGLTLHFQAADRTTCTTSNLLTTTF